MIWGYCYFRKPSSKFTKKNSFALVPSQQWPGQLPLLISDGDVTTRCGLFLHPPKKTAKAGLGPMFFSSTEKY